MNILVLNAGSSTLKYEVVDPVTEHRLLRGAVERVGVPGEDTVPDHAAALARMHEDLDRHGIATADLDAVGHRVVHGGPDLVRPVLIDEDVLARIDDLARWAPLHNPPAAAGIRSARAEYPRLPQVAVFDTGFFANLPAASATYAIDPALAVAQDIRRFGAHGISHAYVAGEAARHLGVDVVDLDQIVLHLGNGASASAISRGRAVDISMGLTPLEGLVMGSRGGDVDPGVLLHLQRHAGLDVEALEDLLQHHSGLAGLTGSSDFRDLEVGVRAGDRAAVLAWDIYVHRLRKYIGAYLAVLGGAEAITFTAGVGEHSADLRAQVLRDLGALGVVVDDTLNRLPTTGPRTISHGDSVVRVLVVPTDEELAIARAVATLITGTAER